MAVAWGRVKDHKGYIDVQSMEGKGTTFALCFPVIKEIDGREKILLIAEYIGNRVSILVVDDVEKQRGIASNLLKK
jgi:two-component system cell cycle sensor histidine kinase/response regulator CckA